MYYPQEIKDMAHGKNIVYEPIKKNDIFYSSHEIDGEIWRFREYDHKVSVWRPEGEPEWDNENIALLSHIE